jgi:hypothetical protein
MTSEIDFPSVRSFLESVARNSRNSKATYETGLKHLQRFLGAGNNNNNNNNNNNYQQNYNIESILSAVQAGSVNIYELLKGFVSYFVVHLSHETHIARKNFYPILTGLLRTRLCLIFEGFILGTL